MLLVGLAFVAFFALVALAVMSIQHKRQSRTISINDIPSFNAQDPTELV